MINAPFMEGFDHRMLFLAMSEAILRRTGRDMELERLFSENELDNLIMAVLVYALEETLAENRNCTIDRMMRFLGELLTSFKPDFPTERLQDLTEYIVKTVLKNDGEPRYYTVLHPEKGFVRVRIDFLADTKEESGLRSFKIHYQLTDQAYDFLFRTKEVENELRFTMEELKLRELIRRKNYGSALRQSNSLIQMLRQKKNELLHFMDRVRENILNIQIGEFETLYRSTYELLKDEYGTMQEIRGMLQLAYEHIQEEMRLRDNLDADMKKAKSDMEKIRVNLDSAIAEQQAMMIDRHSVAELYAALMDEAFSRKMVRRFDFDDVLLKPVMQLGSGNAERMFHLLRPLFLPDMTKCIGIHAVYAPQQKLRTANEAVSGMIVGELELDMEQQRMQQANSFHVSFTERLLAFASEHPTSFRLDAFYEWMQVVEPAQIVNHASLFFQNALRLYEAGAVRIDLWQAERPEVAVNATGEYDLEYCLYQVERKRTDLYGIRILQITWPDDDVFEAQVQDAQQDVVRSHRLRISNLKFDCGE